MNNSNFTSDLIAYLVVAPAAALCMIPLRNQFKLGFRMTLRIAVVFLSVCVVIMSMIEAKLPSSGFGVLFPPFIVLCFTVYAVSTTAPFNKSLSLFLVTCAFMSFFSNYAIGFDALKNPDLTLDQFTMEAAAFQLGISVIFAVVAAWPVWKYGGWLADNMDIKTVWYATVPVTSGFLIYNLMLSPNSYDILHARGVARFYWSSLSLLLVMLIMLCVMYFFIVKGIVDALESDARRRILELEERQFLRQQRYMSETAAARHDFRQAIRTLDTLFKAGDLESMEEFFKDYLAAMPESDIRKYCDNNALNALLNYYVQTAEADGISIDIRIDLPEFAPITDVDMCTIVGNILENAITACREDESEERWIQLTISVPHGAQLCIVATNSFSGKVRIWNGRYYSTNRIGRGTGLSSISRIAQKYNGSAKFSNTDTEFYSDIIIPVAWSEKEQIINAVDRNS